jgi:hypothetical protein
MGMQESTHAIVTELRASTPQYANASDLESKYRSAKTCQGSLLPERVTWYQRFTRRVGRTSGITPEQSLPPRLTVRMWRKRVNHRRVHNRHSVHNGTVVYAFQGEPYLPIVRFA